MTSVYCSQKHENPSGSRFCHLCGEKIQSLERNGAYQGKTLGDRYRVIRELGHGGFGRTYLAEDINRFNEPCVLKEFAPQAQGSYALQKAEELFEREAGVLYKLRHPQIPQFRELFRAQVDGKGRLFLVQDFVEGQTYHALLNDRRRQGQRFSEAEATQLLLQILPVLAYIHTFGVVHRDISPDNLMLRRSDALPVLIDFGGVKQVAAAVESQLANDPANLNGSVPGTRLGKIGYAPDEQMQMGVVSHSSDLYALGVTVLVLLTGREPRDLLDANTLTWTWEREINLSPHLTAVMHKLLAHRPHDRYQSARDVLQALTNVAVPVSYAPTQAPVSQVPTAYPSIAATQAATQAATPTGNLPITVPPQSITQGRSGVSPLLIGLLIAGVGLGSWGISTVLLGKRESPKPTLPPSTTTSAPSPTSPQYSATEEARKEALGKRRRSLGIDYTFFISLVNPIFYAEHSGLNGRPLDSVPEDEGLRAEWDQTADRLLNQLETLSAQSRGKLGKYTQADRERWGGMANQAFLSSRAFNDLVDARFFALFPDQQEQNFINQPIGQVWYAIGADEIKAIQAGTALEKIVFDPGAYRKQVTGILKPGEAKAFIASLAQGQLMRVSLQADSKVKLTIYPPTSSLPPLLKSSSDRTWSSTLQKSGYYEFVLVSEATDPASYALDIAADNLTADPTSSPEPSSPEPSPSEVSPSPAVEPVEP